MTDSQKKHPFLKSILARRFILYILLFSSLITLLGTSLQIYLDYSKDKINIQKTLDQIQTSHLQSFVNNVWVSDQEQINIYLQEILALPDMQYIEIVRGDQEKVSFGTRKSKNILSCEYPLVYSFRNKDINLGSLYIEATLDNVFQRLSSRVSVILLTQGVQILLVSLFIFLIFYLLVGRHLLNMADYARGLDLQTIDTPLRLFRSKRGQNDELDLVVSSLNQMRTSLLVDIARREKIEKEVVRSKAEFEAIFNSITDAVVFVDTEWCIVRINPAFTEKFGYTFEEVKGKSTEFIYVDPGTFKMQVLKRYHQDAEIKQSVYEMEYRRKDGTVFPAETLGAHVQNQAGEVIGFLGIMRDISDRKQAEEEKNNLEAHLRQAYKMEAIGTMAGGIAHDFNNIMAIILGNAEMAKGDIPPGNPANHNIEEILEASNRAKDLVRQILAFSRKEKQRHVPINPQAIIKETLKLLRSTTPTTVSIIQTISNNCGTIKADPTQLHQLIMNLFVNAVYAMDEKGAITVNLQEVNLNREVHAHNGTMSPGHYAMLSISDTGCGMDEDEMGRIFDPFYTTREMGKGTGMGLSVVHGIVKSHGGFITIDSELGKGTVFKVFFPVSKEVAVKENGVTKPLQTGTERVLLVDDEESLLSVAQRMLTALGYKVTTKISSVEALEIFKLNPDQFDFIITDQSMPDMSGAELVAEILKVRPDIPIILCTGYSTKVSEDNAKEKGISKYINKPYSKRLLSEAIREVLDEKV